MCSLHVIPLIKNFSNNHVSLIMITKMLKERKPISDHCCCRIKKKETLHTKMHTHQECLCLANICAPTHTHTRAPGESFLQGGSFFCRVCKEWEEMKTGDTVTSRHISRGGGGGGDRNWQMGGEGEGEGRGFRWRPIFKSLLDCLQIA